MGADSRNPAPWVSTQSFFNGAGNFLSPLIISAVISSRGVFERSYWFYALFAILLSALFMYVPSPKIRKGGEKEGPKAEAEPQMKNMVYLVAAIFLLYTGAEVTYNGLVFTMATSAYPMSDMDGRLLNALFWGAIAVGRIFTGVLSRRFNPGMILQVSFIGAIGSMLLAVIFPASAAILWAASIGSGLFMALIFPTLTLYADKKMGLTGRMTGMFFSATSIGGMLLPWIAGQLFTFINPHMVKVVVALSLLGGYLLFSYINLEKRWK